MCHVQRSINKYIYRTEDICAGVVPELEARIHWSSDELRAGALSPMGGTLGVLVKITQREGSCFRDIWK